MIKPAAVSVRQRTPDDLAACAALLRRVHDLDRFPVRWPTDALAFLTPAEEVVTWVATDGGAAGSELIGHVMLATPPADLAALASCEPGDLLLVRQLFVAPEARGRRVGGHLLDVALHEATARGRRAALEVWSLNTDAIGLYERSGWTTVGTRTPHWVPEGTHAIVFVAPQTAQNGGRSSSAGVGARAAGVSGGTGSRTGSRTGGAGWR